METASLEQITAAAAEEGTSPMEVITSTDATEGMRDFSSAKMDLSTRGIGLGSRIPPFNIAKLLHGHGRSPDGPSPDHNINHPVNFVQENLNNRDGNRNVILNLFKDGDLETGFVTAAVAIFLTLVILVGFYVMRRRRRNYNKIPTSSDVGRYEYFYKPSNGNSLDEEYENTFVGVSVPLLHEVTKI